MEPRLDYTKLAEAYVAKSGLDRRLVNLAILRASQINGCAYCIDMHTKDLRAEGDSEQRLYLLDAGREAPFYTGRERAALAWTEAVTRLTEGHVPDYVYKELVDLTMAIVAINGWNRLNIAFQTVAGSYQPQPIRQQIGSAS